jgi:hypothetical protein
MRERATDDMIRLWHRMWEAVFAFDHEEFSRIKKEIKERYPDDWHGHAESRAGMPYFNIGQAEMQLIWRESYQELYSRHWWTWRY